MRHDTNWIGREFGMPASSLVEPNAPIAVIEDHRATRRVVDMTETDQERLERGLEKMHEAYEILAPLNRQADWRLEARRAACALEEVCGED